MTDYYKRLLETVRGTNATSTPLPIGRFTELLTDAQVTYELEEHVQPYIAHDWTDTVETRITFVLTDEQDVTHPVRAYFDWDGVLCKVFFKLS